MAVEVASIATAMVPVIEEPPQELLITRINLAISLGLRVFLLRLSGSNSKHRLSCTTTYTKHSTSSRRRSKAYGSNYTASLKLIWRRRRRRFKIKTLYTAIRLMPVYQVVIRFNNNSMHLIGIALIHSIRPHCQPL